MLVSSLIELGGRAEAVEVRQASGEVLVTPDLSPKSTVIELARAKQWLGLPLDADSMTDALERMRVDVRPLDSTRTSFEVTYPRFRGDIRHMVDLFEDLAIGFGYANIVPAQIPSMTVSVARPEEARSEMVRAGLSGLGYTEIMSLPLTTEADHYEKLRLPVPARYPRVSNPKLKALTVVRSHLMTGVLQALHENRRRPMPIRLFEMDNVVRLEDGGRNGIAEYRNLCFADVGPDAGYAVARATLDAMLRELGLTAKYEAVEHPTFTTGRVARFTTGTAVQGVIGEVHPEVVVGFGLEYPISLVEMTVSPVEF
jgi:phenylalanyl-tRNA synthetase beta chain